MALGLGYSCGMASRMEGGWRIVLHASLSGSRFLLVEHKPYSVEGNCPSSRRWLDVPPVPLLSWFSLLQKSQMDTGLKNAEKMRRNPAIALLPYLLDSDAEQHKELMGQTIMLSLEKASKVAPQLQDIWIGRQLIAGWVREWRKIGFLPPRSQAATSSRGERGPHCLAWL